MPVAPAQQVMQNPGDICGPVFLGQTGVGNPPDVTAILSLTNSSTTTPVTAATVAIEGVPIGQPLTQGLTTVTQPSPTLANEWVPVAEVGVVNGQLVTSPVGPLNIPVGPSNGFAYTVPCGLYSQLRMRLIATGGGAIQGGIATVPFPVSTALVPPFNPAENLQLGRLMVGISALLAGGADAGGLNLQDLTAADISGLG